MLVDGGARSVLMVMVEAVVVVRATARVWRREPIFGPSELKDNDDPHARTWCSRKRWVTAAREALAHAGEGAPRGQFSSGTQGHSVWTSDLFGV